MSTSQAASEEAGEKRLLIRDISDRSKIRGVYLCARKVSGQDRNGKTFLSILLCDKSGQIDARVFDNAEQVAQGFEERDYVRVSGQAKSFQGRLQLHLQKVERVPREMVEGDEYLPVSRRDPDEMWAELRGAIESVRDPHVGALLRALFEDPEVAARFRRAPAAKTIHHAWIGGLLEHNLSVYRIIDALCAHYARESPGLLDRDLCVAGGLLHDFGKIYELSAEGTFEYTHEGRLIGHLVQCSQKIAEVAARLPGFPRGRLLALQHIVLAHHDRLEYGSPKRPHTAEAMLVHAADLLDSRMGFLRQLFEREPGPGWTTFQKLFERPFYHHGPGEAEVAQEELPSTQEPAWEVE